MAFTDIYRFDFEDDGGGDWSIFIAEDGGTGPADNYILSSRDAVQTTYRASGDPAMFAPFLLSELNIRFIDRPTTASGLDALTNGEIVNKLIDNSDPKRFQMRLMSGATLHWKGYVDTTGMSVNEDFLQIAEIRAVDGLEFLKDLDYVDGAGDFFTGRDTAASIIMDLLNKLNYGLEFRFYVDWYAGGLTEGIPSADNPLEYYYVDREIYRADKVLKRVEKQRLLENGEVETEYVAPEGDAVRVVRDQNGVLQYTEVKPVDCKTVLEDLLLRFNLQVTMEQGRWHIYQSELFDRSAVPRWSYQSNKTLIGGGTFNPRYTPTDEQDERTTAERSALRAYNGVQTIYEHGSASLLINSNLDEYTFSPTVALHAWSITGTLQPILLEPDNKETANRWNYGAGFDTFHPVNPLFVPGGTDPFPVPVNYITQSSNLVAPLGDVGFENWLVITIDYQNQYDSVKRQELGGDGPYQGKGYALPMRIIFHGDDGTDYYIKKDSYYDNVTYWQTPLPVSGDDEWSYWPAVARAHDTWGALLIETADIPQAGTIEISIGALIEFSTDNVGFFTGQVSDICVFDNVLVRMGWGEDQARDTKQTTVNVWGDRTADSNDRLLKRPKVYVGDGPSTAHRSTLTFDAAGKRATSDWKVGFYDTGDPDSDVNIAVLQGRQILQGLVKPVRTHEATWKISTANTLRVMDVLYRGGQAYRPLSYTRNWIKATTSAQWYRIQSDSSTESLEFAGTGGSGVFNIDRFGAGDALIQIFDAERTFGTTSRLVAKTDQDITAGATTSIPIETATESLIDSGDNLIIIDQLLHWHNIVADADVIVGDTALTIQSYTFPRDVAWPASIFMVEEEIVTAIRLGSRGFAVTAKGGYDLIVAAPGASGPTVTSIPIEAAELDINSGTPIVIKHKDGSQDTRVTLSAKVRRGETSISINSANVTTVAGDGMLVSGHVSRGELLIAKNLIELSVTGSTPGNVGSSRLGQLTSDVNASVQTINVTFEQTPIQQKIYPYTVAKLLAPEVGGERDDPKLTEFEVRTAIAEGASPTSLDIGSTAKTRVEYGATQIEFKANAGDDTIERTTGSFITDGFTAGHYVRVEGSLQNEGIYKIQTVAALVITLDPAETLTNEGPIPDVDLTDQWGPVAINAQADFSRINIAGLPPQETRTALTLGLEGIIAEASIFKSHDWDGVVDANGNITTAGTKGWALTGVTGQAADADITGTLHAGQGKVNISSSGIDIDIDGNVTFGTESSIDFYDGFAGGAGSRTMSLFAADLGASPFRYSNELRASLGNLYIIADDTSDVPNTGTIHIQGVEIRLEPGIGQVELDSTYLQFEEIAAPSTPASTFGRLYMKTGNNGLFWKDDAGTETDLTAGGGGGDVTAAANLTDHALIRGDNPTAGKGVQDSGWLLDDSDVLTAAGSLKLGVNAITDANDAISLDWASAASAVNNVRIGNAAASNNPYIAAVGTDANVTLDLWGKGTGVVRVDDDLEVTGNIELVDGAKIRDTSNNEWFEFETVGGGAAINHIGVSRSSTGNYVGLDARGGDANIDFDISPKGTGDVVVFDSAIRLDDITAPGAPGVGEGRLYTKSGAGLFWHKNGQSEVDLTGVGSHTHVAADITDFDTAVDARLDTAQTISAAWKFTDILEIEEVNADAILRWDHTSASLDSHYDLLSDLRGSVTFYSHWIARYNDSVDDYDFIRFDPITKDLLFFDAKTGGTWGQVKIDGNRIVTDSAETISSSWDFAAGGTNAVVVSSNATGQFSAAGIAFNHTNAADSYSYRWFADKDAAGAATGDTRFTLRVVNGAEWTNLIHYDAGDGNIEIFDAKSASGPAYGNFNVVNGTIQQGGVAVSLSGHTHVFADITDRTTAATGITKVGTIDTGVWQGSAIGAAYLDSTVTFDNVAETITGLWEFAHASGLKTGVITEAAPDDGVTVDGVLLKDSYALVHRAQVNIAGDNGDSFRNPIAQNSIEWVDSTSSYQIVTQDGTGRVNHYWNAYYDSGVDARHEFMDAAGDRALNFEITSGGNNGQFVFNISDGVSVASGDPVTWIRMLLIDADPSGDVITIGDDTHQVPLRFDSGLTNDPDIRANTSGDLILRSHATSSRIEFEVGNPEAIVAAVDSAGLLADVIGEVTAAAGVTIDGVTIKDGDIYDMPTIFDTNDNALLDWAATASAVNNLRIVNAAAGNSPYLRPVGSDTDIVFQLGAQFNNAYQEALELAGSLNATDYIRITAGSSLQDVRIETVGGQTNINLDVIPKGTGEFRYNGNEVLTGATGIANPLTADLDMGGFALVVNDTLFVDSTGIGADPVVNLRSEDSLSARVSAATIKADVTDSASATFSANLEFNLTQGGTTGLRAILGAGGSDETQWILRSPASTSSPHIYFQAEDSLGNNTNYGRFRSVVLTSTDGLEESEFNFDLADGGALLQHRYSLTNEAILPNADGVRDVGATATRFKEGFFDDLTLTNGLTVDGGTAVFNINVGTNLNLDNTAASGDIRIRPRVGGGFGALWTDADVVIDPTGSAATAQFSVGSQFNIDNQGTSGDINIRPRNGGGSGNVRIHSDLLPGADSTYDSGATATRWANLFVDNITMGGTASGSWTWDSASTVVFNTDIVVGQSSTAQILADESAGVGSPAYSFDGDSNCGFYRVAADQIGVSTAGTYRMKWTDGGMRVEDGYKIASDVDLGEYLQFIGTGTARSNYVAIGGRTGVTLICDSNNNATTDYVAIGANGEDEDAVNYRDLVRFVEDSKVRWYDNADTEQVTWDYAASDVSMLMQQDKDFVLQSNSFASLYKFEGFSNESPIMTINRRSSVQYGGAVIELRARSGTDVNRKYRHSATQQGSATQIEGGTPGTGGEGNYLFSTFRDFTTDSARQLQFLAFVGSETAPELKVNHWRDASGTDIHPCADFKVFHGPATGQPVEYFRVSYDTDKGAVSLVNSAQFRAQDGSAGAPGISFASDTDTGMYRAAAQLGFAVGGSTKLRWENDGWRFYGGIDLSTSVQYVDNGSGNIMQFSTSGILMQVTGSAGTPLYRMNDADTGFYGSAEINASVNGTEKFSIQSDRIEEPANVGTTFPTSPAEGQRYYRSDLEEWFYYDSSRSKWLGTSLITLQFAKQSLGAAGYLNFGNVVTSSTKGFLAPFTVTVVGVSCVRTTTQTGNIEVHDDGTSVTTVFMSTNTKAKNMTRNVDIAEDSVIAARASMASSDVMVQVFLRRTAS